MWNDGKGIPIKLSVPCFRDHLVKERRPELLRHKKYKVFVPELVFGHLLTSDNYDDSERHFAERFAICCLWKALRTTYEQQAG